MNEKIAICVEGLGKRYRLGQRLDLTRTFRETLISLPRFFGRKAKHAAGSVRRKIGREDGAGSSQPDPSTPSGTFWALRDVDFTVRSGEVLGIIGRNGAGKSTLLKVLSRITSPTEGRAEIHGRMGSLLEVGTGFHPELTGRENIFLNGAILGMRKAEIERKFDEIVAFAEVDRFLDTPVKRYSSGMYVRLAFAVAAHLEPEILVVDEVLAVGDAAFQRKCLGKMGDVAQSGRTVLFVSHNLGAVRQLCNRCVLLEKGRVKLWDTTDAVVDYYSEQAAAPSLGRGNADLTGRKSLQEQNPDIYVARVATMTEEGEIRSVIPGGTDLVFELEIVARREMPATIALSLTDFRGILMVNMINSDYAKELHFKKGKNIVRVTYRRQLLRDGDYTVWVWLGSHIGQKPYDFAQECLTFSVDNSNRGHFRTASALVVDADWELNPEQ